MASGDVVGLLWQAACPAANHAERGVRAGGSTPAENHPVWRFDDTTTEYIDFYGQLQGYAGGGLTVVLPWMAVSATTGSVRWGAAFRRIADDAEDLDTSQTYDFNTVDDAAASAAGELSYPSIMFTNGADMDSLADGERFILRIQRVGGEPSGSTLTGDASLFGPPIIKET